MNNDLNDLTQEEINNIDEVETITYMPTHVEDSLECEDEAYGMIDYYSLTHPSQTIDVFCNNCVVVATNPDAGTASVQILDLDKIQTSDILYKQVEVNVSYNRIRNNKNINAVSDNFLDIYDGELCKLHSVYSEHGFGYGLCVRDELVLYSDVSGEVTMFSDRKVDAMNVHSSSIESLSVFENLLFSCSTDKTSKITDLRTKSAVVTKKSSCDINAIAYNTDNLVAYGDDEGVLSIFDMRMPDNNIEIKWHKTNVTAIKWRNTDVFCGVSDEQVCIYDMSLDDEWEYEKYLLFVHQGQRYYKDICFSLSDNDVIVSTSLDGLCFFKPISFLEYSN